MSVIVITGQPGSGKTALCVDMLAHDDQFSGRPLFVMGIPDLLIEHTPCPPVTDWTEYRKSPEDESIELAYFTFPPNSVVVIDEAQRIYRPRATGSRVPPEVAAFETHRHEGIDFVLLTQHPGLLDSNIRKLVGRHIHIRVTPMGRYRYDWTELGDPESSSSRGIASKEKYKLPKRAFDLYKSSQLHTKIRVKMPWFVYVFLFAAIGALVLGYYVFNRIKSKSAPVPVSQSTGAGGGTMGKKSPNGHDTLTTADYLDSQIPRIPGLAHTAPRYDEITTPNDAPWPQACMVTAAWRGKPESCRCVDQQGHKYVTPDSMCRQIVANGLFKDWQGPEKPDKDMPRQTAQPAGGAGSVGGFHAGQVASNPPPMFPGQVGQGAPAAPPPQVVQGEQPPRQGTVPLDSPVRFKGTA